MWKLMLMSPKTMKQISWLLIAGWYRYVCTCMRKVTGYIAEFGSLCFLLNFSLTIWKSSCDYVTLIRCNHPRTQNGHSCYFNLITNPRVLQKIGKNFIHICETLLGLNKLTWPWNSNIQQRNSEKWHKDGSNTDRDISYSLKRKMTIFEIQTWGMYYISPPTPTLKMASFFTGSITSRCSIKDRIWEMTGIKPMFCQW